MKTYVYFVLFGNFVILLLLIMKALYFTNKCYLLLILCELEQRWLNALGIDWILFQVNIVNSFLIQKESYEQPRR